MYCTKCACIGIHVCTVYLGTQITMFILNCGCRYNIRVCIRIYIYIYIYMYYMYICMCICMYIYIYIYTHILEEAMDANPSDGAAIMPLLSYWGCQSQQATIVEAMPEHLALPAEFRAFWFKGTIYKRTRVGFYHQL